MEVFTLPLMMFPLRSPCLYRAAGHRSDLPYSVELWDEHGKHVEELIALTGDFRVARAAFEEAVKRRADRDIETEDVDCSRIAGEKISTSVPARTNLHREEAALR